MRPPETRSRCSNAPSPATSRSRISLGTRGFFASWRGDIAGWWTRYVRKHGAKARSSEILVLLLLPLLLLLQYNPIQRPNVPLNIRYYLCLGYLGTLAFPPISLTYTRLLLDPNFTAGAGQGLRGAGGGDREGDGEQAVQSQGQPRGVYHAPRRADGKQCKGLATTGRTRTNGLNGRVCNE